MSEHTQELAVIGAPSTTGNVTVTLRRNAYNAPVYGQMVTFTHDIVDPDTARTHRERALGTVTEVETVNALFTARAPEAIHVATDGHLPHRTGDQGDTRAVDVAVEAVFRDDPDENAAPGQHTWAPAGASLSNSPATGLSVRLVDQKVVNELMHGVEHQRWIGTLRASSTRIPWTARDYSGPRGAWHGAVVGATGSGKTQAANWMIASDLYFDTLGTIIFDPQAQFAHEHGNLFSLQGFARALGRKVTVARLSRTLRLRKDADMFTDLLTRVDLFRELSFGSGSADQVAAAATVFKDALDDKKQLRQATGVDDWTEADAGDLLAYLLEELREVLPTGVVYAGRDGQDRVRYAIRKPTPDELEEDGQDAALTGRHRDGILDERHSNGRRWRKVMTRFAPIHNMWSPLTPDGARKVAAGTPRDALEQHELRRKAWGLISDVFSPAPNEPAPVLIIDLSVDVDASLLADDVDDEDAAAADEARQALDHPGVKARIMRQLVGDLGRAGLGAFKSGEPLNTAVWFDEAWQFAGPVDASTDRDVARLGDALEDGARDLRKLGVGLRFILQTPSGLREGIWKQCAIRAIGYGITEQSDIKRLANIVGDRHLRLYLATAGPEATGRYPFMVTGGGATGLSFGTKPVFMDMETDPEHFLACNAEWISDRRRRYAHLLPDGDRGGELTSMPTRPANDTYLESVRHAQGLRKGAANAAAAKRLTSAPSAPKAAFGMQPAARHGWLAPDQDAIARDDAAPPPF